MDLFEHRYYRLSKKCMTLVGQWPYQSAFARRSILAAIIFVTVTGLAPPIMALVKNRDDWGIVLDCVNSCLFAAVCIMKFLGIMWNSQKVSYVFENYDTSTMKDLKLLNSIFTNWQVWARGREVNILHEYAEQGEKMTFVYTAAIYMTIILFTTQPIIPKIIDVLLKNGTEIGKFPYPVDYHYFDAQKYYCYIMMHFYVCTCVAAMPLVASDGMLIIYVQHVCGVFAALGHKLEQIGDNDTSVQNVGNLSSFIDRHNDAIEYAYLIEAAYRWIFFFNIGIGLILINILGLQILMRTDDPESTIRFVAMVLSLELVFYTECYISQILEDHSINVGYYIHNSRWYRISPRAQKILQLMAMRCRVPCQLTAGKMLIMSLKTFGLTFRTAMSYFAVVRNTDVI